MRVVLVLLLFAAAVAAEEIRLRNGDVINGTVVERTEKYWVIDHPDLGRITIPTDKLSPVIDLPPVEAPPDPEKKSIWDLSISGGGALTNDDEGVKTQFNLGLVTSRATERARTRLRLSYIFNTKQGATDKHNGLGVLSHRFLLKDSRWFVFLVGRYDFDQFRSWEHRLTAHAGPGYTVIKAEEFLWDLLAGVGGRKEFESENDDFEAEALLGTQFYWIPNPRNEVGLNLTWYPALGDVDDERFIAHFEWKFLLDKKSRLSLVTNLDWEYDTSPDPGFPNDNVRWTWGLQWDF
ncbi:MAG: DUF481 domain-containing protein [Planctomycetota bacterium]|jgi:hypothetical protein